MTLMSVVLPEPFGPTRPTDLPAPARRLTPRKAWMPPNAFHTSCTGERGRRPWSLALAGGVTVGAPSRGPVSTTGVRGRQARQRCRTAGTTLGQEQDYQDEDERHRGAAQTACWPPVKA